MNNDGEMHEYTAIHIQRRKSSWLRAWITFLKKPHLFIFSKKNTYLSQGNTNSSCWLELAKVMYAVVPSQLKVCFY